MNVLLQFGGDLVSTGLIETKMACRARSPYNADINIIADDYNYAVAA